MDSMEYSNKYNMEFIAYYGRKKENLQPRQHILANFSNLQNSYDFWAYIAENHRNQMFCRKWVRWKRSLFFSDMENSNNEKNSLIDFGDYYRYQHGFNYSMRLYIQLEWSTYTTIKLCTCWHYYQHSFGPLVHLPNTSYAPSSQSNFISHIITIQILL